MIKDIDIFDLQAEREGKAIKRQSDNLGRVSKGRDSNYIRSKNKHLRENRPDHYKTRRIYRNKNGMPIDLRSLATHLRVNGIDTSGDLIETAKKHNIKIRKQQRTVREITNNPTDIIKRCQFI